MKRINQAIQSGLLILGILAAQSWADNKGGTTAVPFLTMGVSARALAMGEAAASSTNDATALYWNPGALLRTLGHSATFMHATSLEDTSFDYVSYAKSNGSSAWGASLQYFTAGNVDKTDFTGEKTGSLAPSDLALTGGYARSLRGYGLGASAKYIQSKLLDTAKTLAVDGGISSPRFWKDRLRVGASLANLGGKIKYDQESAPLPLTLRAGVEATPCKGWVGEVDVVAPRGDDLHLALGGEYRLTLMRDISLAFRGGYNTRASSGGSAKGISAGLGFGWRSLTVDYAFVSRGDLDPSQVFSVGYGF